MEAINLTRVDLIAAQGDPWIAAIMADFYVPPGARVFVGSGLDEGERVVFFIDKTGGGTGYIDRDPAGYIEMSKTLAAFAHYEEVHGVRPEGADTVDLTRGPDEYEFDEGSYDYNAREIIQDASMSLF
jgi:hypothetical protein